MARGDQLGRQWKIIQALISSKLGKSAADLAGDLDCNPRTVSKVKASPPSSRLELLRGSRDVKAPHLRPQ